MPEQTYPDQYLHVEETRSGREWVVPLRSNAQLALTKQVKRWIKNEFSGEFVLDGKLVDNIEGEYFAQILTDGRPPTSVVVWDCGGFFLKPKGS